MEQQPDDAELWAGTAADLLTALEQVATDQKIDLKARSWPKAANALMRRLNEVRSNLLDLGIQVTSEPDGTQRQVTFQKVYRKYRQYRQYRQCHGKSRRCG